MRPDLIEALELHKALLHEADKGIVGLQEVKLMNNVALFSMIPTSHTGDKRRRSNSGAVLYKGVPGVGKTYFCIVFAAATKTKTARVQGRADLVPADILGAQVYNPKTGEFETHTGPIVDANIFLIDELNRTPPKSQSAFIEALQERTVTIGKETYHLPEFNFTVATINPIETGQGTFPVSDATADRFTFEVDVSYVSAQEEERLVDFDFEKVEITSLATPERIIALRSAVREHMYVHPLIKKYIRRLVRASRPARLVKEGTRSPSTLVEEFVELPAGPRATIHLGRTVPVYALFANERDAVYPEDVQALLKYVLRHRIKLAPVAEVRGITVDQVIRDIIERVPVP